MDYVINNSTSHDLTQLEKLAREFLPYAQKRMGFNKPPVINFLSDEENSLNPLGKTGFYNPSEMGISLMVDGRHVKDVLRSLSHELVHHTQNCRGDFNREISTHAGYAQDDEFLRKMEDEAYRDGNFCLRDWEDGIKREQGKYKQLNETIYKHTLKEGEITMSTEEWKNEELNGNLMEKWGYTAPEPKAKEEKKEKLNEALEPYMNEKDYSTGEKQLGEDEEEETPDEITLEDENLPQSVEARNKSIEKHEEVKKENLSYSEKIVQDKKDNKDPFHLYETWLTEESDDEPKKKDNQANLESPSGDASQEEKIKMLNILKSGDDEALRNYFKMLAKHYFEKEGHNPKEVEDHLDMWADDALQDIQKIGMKAEKAIQQGAGEGVTQSQEELKEAIIRFNKALKGEKINLNEVSRNLILIENLLSENPLVKGGKKGAKKGAKGGAKKGAKKAGEETAKKGGEKAAKKGGEKAAKEGGKKAAKEGGEEAVEGGLKKKLLDKFKQKGGATIKALANLCWKNKFACTLVSLAGFGYLNSDGPTEEEMKALDSAPIEDLKAACKAGNEQACLEIMKRKADGTVGGVPITPDSGIPDPDGRGNQPGTERPGGVGTRTPQPKPKRYLGMSVRWLEGRGWKWMPENGDFAKKSKPDYWLSRDHCKGSKYCKKKGRSKRRKATVKKKPMMSQAVANTGVGGADYGPGTSGMSPPTLTNPNTGKPEALTPAGQDALNDPEVTQALKKGRQGQ